MKAPLDSASREELLHAAREAARHSYSPYSRFRVGAAVRTARGVFTGANVENASYGLCLCAERSAMASALAAGAREMEAIAVACVDAPAEATPGERMPCGACRQWMVELAPEAEILVDGVEGVFTVAQLLASPFVLPVRG
jgi:cytidine deaminase